MGSSGQARDWVDASLDGRQHVTPTLETTATPLKILPRAPTFADGPPPCVPMTVLAVMVPIRSAPPLSGGVERMGLARKPSDRSPLPMVVGFVFPKSRTEMGRRSPAPRPGESPSPEDH